LRYNPYSKEHAKLTFVFFGYQAKQVNGALQQVFGKVSPLQPEVAEHQVEIRWIIGPIKK